MEVEESVDDVEQSKLTIFNPGSSFSLDHNFFLITLKKDMKSGFSYREQV